MLHRPQLMVEIFRQCKSCFSVNYMKDLRKKGSNTSFTNALDEKKKKEAKEFSDIMRFSSSFRSVLISIMATEPNVLPVKCGIQSDLRDECVVFLIKSGVKTTPHYCVCSRMLHSVLLTFVQF